MKTLEQFKAAFMKNSTLSKKLRDRVTNGLDELQRIRSLAETLGDDTRDTAIKSIDDLEGKIVDAASNGVQKPGDAWVEMDGLLKQVANKRIEILGLNKKADKADPMARFNRALDPTYKAIAQARSGTRGIPDEKEVKRLQKAVTDLTSQVVTLVTKVGKPPAKPTAQQCELLESYRLAAGDLVREVRGAQGLAPQAGTQRAASNGVIKGVSGIKAIGDRLNSPKKDAQGRTAMQDLQGRLEVFDDKFAGDPNKDPEAGRRNKAMRMAAIATVTADRISQDVNDPYLRPRIGQSLISEYAPEMKDSLAVGDDDDDESAGALLLAQALVMDDPITKLMTGKMDPSDAVQRIRDMAAVAGEPPSVMFKLLRQQFEMRLGSLDASEVIRGTKEKDEGAKGNFELSEITGELSSKQFADMLELGTLPTTQLGPDKRDQPKWKDDGSGLAFKPTSRQTHTVKKGDTFGTLANTYLNDENKWQEIQKDNKVILDAKTRKPIDLQGLKKSDPLPEGAVLYVPGVMSLLDQLGPYVDAWDGAEADTKKETESGTDQKGKSDTKGKKTVITKEDEENRSKGYMIAASLSSMGKVTPEKLKEGFARLRSTKAQDPSYIQVPGLGQEYKPDKPLGEEEKIPSGQINDRQYAHLRMLARSDQEDREAVLRKEGKPLDDVLAEKIRARYGKNRVDDNMARKIAKAAEGWVAKVPLTVTFTASRLFSDPSKDAPTHGSQYKSDVEITRGKENMKDLIGRDNTVKGQVGTQGGSKTVTGWKERGENYMRWRRDKDNREGRNDDLAYEDQQIFGAANAPFSKAKGGAAGSFGSNYYGDAHFLLRDAVRNRCAFIVRASAGAKTPPVQRKDIGMLLYDMLTNGDADSKFLDAMIGIAAGSSKITVPSLDWEVHLYGGFDLRKDAAEIYLPDGLDDQLVQRITKFASANGVKTQKIGAKPTGLEAVARQDPTQIELPAL